MVLLSAHGLPPAEIAAPLDCHPATVRRWISRFNREGAAGLADRPRSGRPRPGGRRLTGRIAALLARRAVVLAEDETHLNLLPHVRASWTLRTARPQIPTPGTNRQVTVFGAIEVSTGRWVYRLGRRCPQGHRLPGRAPPAGTAVRRPLQPARQPAERIWAALKNYVANTAVTWPGRLRQIHSFFRNRSPGQMLATAALDQPLAIARLRAELLECRLVGAVLVEIHDEWQVGERRYPVRRIHGPPHQATRKLGGPSHTRTAQGIASNGPLATSTVKVIHTAPCDLTDGRYDHTTPLGKLI